MNPNDFLTAEVFPPDERLTEVFRHIYCIRQSEEAPAIVQKQLVPNYEMMLMLNFGPDVAIVVGDTSHVVQQTAVLGPLHKALRYEVPPGADVIVVVFTLNGFYRLLNRPMHELRAEAEPLLNDARFRDLWEPLSTMPTLTDRIEFLNAYTLLRLAPAGDDALSILDGVLLFNNPAIDPVKAIAGKQQLTPRSVQIRFQTHLGFSAKELARFLRFKKLVAKLVEQHPTPPDWADLVFLHGYHDQSHLIRDFQQFMGLTPTEFVQQFADQTVCITQPGKHY